MFLTLLCMALMACTSVKPKCCQVEECTACAGAGEGEKLKNREKGGSSKLLLGADFLNRPTQRLDRKKGW